MSGHPASDSVVAPPRVRVAPSPTGDPHVGTAYMALFNLAFARRYGGAFLLRIEDTDRARYDQGSEQRILEALAWLGLSPDEGAGAGGDLGPYYQSQRLPVYERHAAILLERGMAYRCFCTRERLDQLRAQQKADKHDQGYDRHCRRLPADAAIARAAAGESHVLRLAVPESGKTGWKDWVRDDIEFENAGIDDQVLVKADGFPTYHLANVVDDHLMGITHVIRGEEWISSTPKHLLLYTAFGWKPPQFAHMPLLRRPGGAKISKRKDPTNVLWFRDQGFLPEALCNFLGNMGFSLPGDREIYTRAEMFAAFDFSRVKPSGPEFDLTKLAWMNGEYIRALPGPELVRRAAEWMSGIHRDSARFQPPSAAEWARATTPEEKQRIEDDAGRRAALLRIAHLHELHAARPDVLARIGPHVRERLHTWPDLGPQLHFLYEELDYDAALLVPKKGSAALTHAALREVRDGYAALAAGDWQTERLEAAGRELCDRLGWKVKDLFLALRVAVTFSTVSPPLFQSMEILGSAECTRRVDRALEKLDRAVVA